MKKHNFSAGPSILEQSVLSQASNAIINYNNSNLSLLEISHRSKDFIAIMEEARALTLELLKLDTNQYTALFLQGGASLQFVMTAQNFLKSKAGYINTGTWSNNAIKEATVFGEVIEVASSKDKNYNYIPDNIEVPNEIDYLHLTSNNTIFGTQFKTFPKTNVPVFVDMSSDIFSRDIDYSYFDLIYAGAQKNAGPAGTTLVIIKKELLDKIKPNIPNYLNYKMHADKDSMYNTPPVFAVYVTLLTLRFIKEQGGVKAIEDNNNAKAKLVYDEIDKNPLFEAYISKASDRSTMNATFNLVNEQHKPIFDALLQQVGISGLNGHRSVGGYRASMYNALPIESVALLVKTMQELKNNI